MVSHFSKKLNDFKKNKFKILKPWKQIDAMIMETAFFCNNFSNFQPIKKVVKENNIQSYNPIFFSW